MAVWVNAPLVPVTVNGYEPLFTELDAVTVRVVDEALTGFDEKLPVAPLGKPVTDIVTGDVNPPARLTFTV